MKKYLYPALIVVLVLIFKLFTSVFTFFYILPAIVVLYILNETKAFAKNNTRDENLKKTLNWIVISWFALSVLAGGQIKTVQRTIAIKRAGKIIKYLEEYKKKNGEYPESLKAGQLSSSKIPGVISVCYYKCFSKKYPGKYKYGDIGSGIEKKYDFYELKFAQTAGLIDPNYWVIFRSDRDYSNAPYLKDAADGWKYKLQHF